MFAQAAPEIGTWVLVALLVLNGLGGIGGLIAVFATRREVDAIDKRLGSIEGVQRDDTADLHEKINSVALEVSAISSKTEMQNQQLARIDVNVQRLAERKS